MPESQNLLSKAARGESTVRTPVWLMRQAGRVLPEYRKVRDSVKDFKALVTTPELAAEVTLQPVRILGVDAAIIFSDILVIPEAMGLPYEMHEGSGPFFPRTIESERDLAGLAIADPEQLSFVAKAIRMVRNELSDETALIGFAGAPWTIFCYMIEGGGSKTFSAAKRWLYTQPKASHRLLSMIADSTIGYLKSQIAAGADIVQIFDSWAGALGPDQYHEFALPYIRRICEAVSSVPRIVFPKGAFYARAEMETVSCEVVGLDWTVDPAESRRIMPTKVLQGNLDPCALYGSLDDVRKETRKMLQAFGPTHHIANLGHGLYPDTEVDKVRAFVDTVKDTGNS